MKGLAIFLGGVIVGAAGMALAAPERGEDLRARIKMLLMKRGIVKPDRVEEFAELIAQEIEGE
ncbi:MAG: YtxH domain-containing protein [Odoribacter sp.]|nr:YtxH domain-containing protein [Odoribacter sp.]